MLSLRCSICRQLQQQKTGDILCVHWLRPVKNCFSLYSQYFSHQLLRISAGEGPPQFGHQLQVHASCTSDQLAINHDHLLRINNLLEWFTELKEAQRLLCLVYYKEDNSGTATWESCIRQNMWEGAQSLMPSPGAPPSQHLPVFTRLVQSGCGFVLRVQHICMIDSIPGHWELIQSPAPLLSPRWGQEETR